MQMAYLWGIEEFLPAILPPNLQDIDARVAFINEMDNKIFVQYLELYSKGRLKEEDKKKFKKITGKWARQYMPPGTRIKDAASIALRLWSGCIMAAKTIADRTMSGPNTRKSRYTGIRFLIEPFCKADPIFLAGAEAAPAFRKSRGAECFYDGIPKKFIKKMKWT